MLVANRISKYFYIKERKGLFSTQKKKLVLNAVSVKIEEGKIVGILGENGAGKTTLIKILATLLLPDSGYIEFDGHSIKKNKNDIRSKINMITGGERNIYWRLSAKENLEYFAALYKINKKQTDIRVEKLLKQVGLWDKRDIPVEQFSKGMKQRLQIAKGLINDPKYIFLDEPTLGLDVSIAKELRSNIKELAMEQNKGILITSHYIKEVEDLCDYIYILKNGKLLLEGTKEEIFKKSNLGNEYHVDVIYNNKESLIKKLECKKMNFSLDINKIKFPNSNLSFSDFVKMIDDLPIEIIKIEQKQANLEDVLLKIRED